MRKISLLLIAFASIATLNAQATISTFTDRADSFMKNYVNDGRVSYVNVKKNLDEITSLYEAIGNMDLGNADANTKKAFYLNAYNLIVIYQVSKFYPLKSPLDQSGFFDQVRHKVAGENITLNELEIKKIILGYKDPRIHFALACAAVSCPKLASFAYRPNILDQQLEGRTRLAINDPSFIRIQTSDGTVNISEIFKWYSRDFTMNGSTVMGFINNYRKSRIPDSYEQGYYQYDWKLNEQ